MGTRKFEVPVQLDSTLKIPAGAGAGKYLTSDSSGFGTWGGPIIPLSAVTVGEVGMASQIRAGRPYVLADFTTNLGLSTPVGVWNLGDGSDISGNSLTLTNKGSPTFGKGITGATTEALILDGASALYRGTVGSGTAGRIAYGSWACWVRTARRAGGTQVVISREAATNAASDWEIAIQNGGIVRCGVFIGSTFTSAQSITDAADDRWHFLVGTHDGTFVRLYVDGHLEASSAVTGPINQGTQPLNIGGWGADGSTAVSQGLFGRIDEAFVLNDVLSLDQVRYLYAAKTAHGASFTPTSAAVGVRRLKKVEAAVGIFSTQPKHLYNFTAGALTDAGSLNNTLTNNGTTLASTGVDGLTGNAFQFNGSTQYLSATDTGLPATTTARSIGCWFKTTKSGSGSHLIMYGTTDFGLYVQQDGLGGAFDGTNTTQTSTAYNDGRWHFILATWDNSAVDGLKCKLYIDGTLVASNTAFTSGPTLAGANGLKIARQSSASANFFSGTLDGVFITDYAIPQDEVSKLYAQGSQSLGLSPKNDGDHIERIDATYAYHIFDSLESQHQIDLRMAA